MSDIDEIMAFIRKFWRKNHILASDRDFFMYEHGNNDKSINFVLAICRSTNAVHAIQGFIPYSKEEGRLHICGVLSKTHPDNNVPYLGVETMRRMLDMTQPITYCGIGTNPKTWLPLLKKFFNRYVGVMSHYYMLNHEIDHFRIAAPGHEETSIIPPTIKKTGFSLKIIKTFSEVKNLLSSMHITEELPFKGCDYIKRRYLENPYFSYQIYRINEPNGLASGILVTRETIFRGRKILSIIDYIGDIKKLGNGGNIFQILLRRNNYEYIDCLCEGIDESIFNQIGFKKKTDKTKTVIPIYFQPFIQENIKIHFEKSHLSMVLFKGDSDADRPNSNKDIKEREKLLKSR